MPHVSNAKGKRDKLWKKQRGLCHWCKRQMNKRPPPDPLSCTLDHVVPYSKGGGGHFNNLVAACRQCNNGRGSEGWTPEIVKGTP